MANSKLRRCCVDFNEYTYCPHCKEDNPNETWRFCFCSEKCRDIYNITSSFEDGRLTANEAKAQLDKLNLSNIENFGESYKNSIAKIMTEENVVITPVIEENKIIEEPLENIMKSEDDVEEEIKTKNYRKSKKKTVEDVE
jgi:hypothetical protein